jgi:hypothetical protein
LRQLSELADDLEEVVALLNQVAPPGGPHDTQGIGRARGVLETASSELAAANAFGPSFKIANAALAISQARLPHVAVETEAQLLRLAIRLYDSINNNGRFTQSRDACTRRLDELHQPFEAQVDPPDIDASVEQIVDARTPSEDSGIGHAAKDDRRPTEDSLADDTRQKWAEMLARWRATADSGPAIGQTVIELTQFADALIRRVPSAVEHLAPLLREDFESVHEELEGIGRPANPTAILDRAAEARGLTMGRGNPVDEATLRKRWLTVATWNFSLWRDSGWGTNRPQVIIDLTGYVQAFQFHRRYRDDSRELLIAATELATNFLIDVDHLPSLVYERVPFLSEWIKHSVGTFLLLSGPEPIAPSLSRYDSRVGRHDRLRWAEVLLGLWRVDQTKRLSACLGLLGLSGWNGLRLRRLLELVFRSSATPVVDGIDFWADAAGRLLESTRWVRIAANPWAPRDAIQATSLSTDEEAAQVSIPNTVLKAVAAEITSSETPSTIQGALFRGRRVPTYLCVNDFGPFGILKVDIEDRVHREKRNFDAFAKRLHPRHRASECIEGQSLISDHSTSFRHKAILTSYVFTEEDEPRTLAEWLCRVGDIGNKTVRGHG